LNYFKVSEETESDARQAIEDFEKDVDLQKQLENWRKDSKSAKKDQHKKPVNPADLVSML
jgi:hypothetical protein